MAYELEMLFDFFCVVFGSLVVQLYLAIFILNEIVDAYRVNKRSKSEWNRLYPKYRVRTEYFVPKRRVK